MAGEIDDLPGNRAVETLQKLGLTEYQARCFVALVRVSSATAKEVSRIADVPYTRVYNTVEELKGQGLVEVQETDPREFRAIPADDAIRALRDEYEARLETAERTLSSLETESDTRHSGSWEISDHEQVTRRATEIVAEADDEVILVGTDEQLFETQLLRRLGDAAGDAEVVVGVPGEDAREQVEDRAPEAEVIEWNTIPDNDWSLGRILMVDRSAVMLSSLRGNDLPGVCDESAVWARGLDHGLVMGVSDLLVTLMDARDVY
ncbi:TrmB family transcriptional regulator [Halorussus lipolyticus]|uniref:TrmB family transcriptional regulator n=1 Tax=Halorussus lipolyticus TaxID=3034024 RepID=UPI0023E8EE12|nr:helix-turn-helix domain-containing protein [Halorussus sp. DT80]